MKRVKENVGSSNDPLSGALNGQNDTINGINEPINVGNDPLNDPLNDREKKIFNLIRLTGGLRRNYIANKLEVSEVTIKRALQKLTGLSLIEYRGSKKTGGYYIKEIQK